MGITIHYRGRLDHFTDLPKFVDELEDIARSMRWRSRRIDRDEDNGEFAGIILSPPDKTESIIFLFDRQGRLRNIADLITMQGKSEPPFSFYSSVKTQHGKLKTHVWIVGLLRYLKEAYISDLEVTDEGDFWETGDVQKLREKRALLQEKMDHLAHGLSKKHAFREEIDRIGDEIDRIIRESRKSPDK